MGQRSSEHGRWEEADAVALTGQLLSGLGQYAVAFMDLEGRIRGWNEACHSITGFSADDVRGRSASVLFTPDDVARDLHTHELNTARRMGFAEDERWHMRKEGSRFWASGKTILLLAGGQPHGFAKIFRDATHLKLRMDWLENEARALRRERGDRDVFLATIAHELRNPLQPMTLATRLLADPSEPSRQEQAVRILQRQLGFIERLVEDLIDMTRVGQGRMNVDYQTVQLQHLLQEGIESLRDAATARDIALASVLPEVPIDVEVDPGRLHQVLINLLNNAVKFTPAGGKVTVLANADESHFTVKVQDTGRGIAPALQTTIFEMFTQAEPADTRRGQGLGIGLALVKQIVSLHHGSVEVRSEGAGKGSEFLVRIPLAKPPGSGGSAGDAQDIS